MRTNKIEQQIALAKSGEMQTMNRFEEIGKRGEQRSTIEIRILIRICLGIVICVFSIANLRIELFEISESGMRSANVRI